MSTVLEAGLQVSAAGYPPVSAPVVCVSTKEAKSGAPDEDTVCELASAKDPAAVSQAVKPGRIELKRRLDLESPPPDTGTSTGYHTDSSEEEAVVLSGGLPRLSCQDAEARILLECAVPAVIGKFTKRLIRGVAAAEHPPSSSPSRLQLTHSKHAGRVDHALKASGLTHGQLTCMFEYDDGYEDCMSRFDTDEDLEADARDCLALGFERLFVNQMPDEVKLIKALAHSAAELFL